jgi:hypothetical protein
VTGAWVDASTARVRWEGPPGSYRVQYVRVGEDGGRVENWVTVASLEASLRGLVPGCEYTVSVAGVGGGAEGTAVGHTVLKAAKVPPGRLAYAPTHLPTYRPHVPALLRAA